MRVDRLGLEDFRNYDRAEIAFVPGLNLVVGRNAQGKTNLLEAVYCLSGLGSPRGPDAVVVREGSERALVHADVARERRSVRVDVELRPGRGTRALINRTPAAPRALADVFTGVFFGPDDLALVKAGPDGRRRFVDDLVVKLRPARYGLRREFERVLKQRNALLKTAPRGARGRLDATLEVWDTSLARAGAALSAARLETMAALAPVARKLFEEIAGGGSFELAYLGTWLPEEAAAAALVDPTTVDQTMLHGWLRDAIASARDREIERGVSLVGPQRDDIAVHISAPDDSTRRSARTLASQGEQRTCALALKLAEHNILTDALGEEPVLLLDDVFSELDPMRRAWLADAVRLSHQAILTSAEPDRSVTAEAMFEVTAGRVRRA